MKKIFALFLFVVSFLTIQAQTPYDTVNVRDPQNFVEMTSVDTAYFQLIGRKANLNRRMSLTTLKNWILSGVSGIDSVYYIGDQLNILQGSTLWQATTGRVADSLVLSNDSLFLYENGTSIFVDLAGISADSTVFATLYALADTAAAIRGDFPAPDGNGLFDASNDGDTTGIGSVVLGEDLTVDLNSYDWLFDGLVEDDTTSRIMTLRGDGSIAYRWLDSLLNGYTTGSGTPGTLPIWTGANALGNSSISESGTVVGTSFTGAFGLATGTTAQAPVGANGRMRYNTTENGISAWNGSAAAWRYLPWADADNFATNRIPFSNGSNLTSSGNFYFTSDRLYVGTSSLLFVGPTSGTPSVNIGTSSTLGNNSVAIGGGAVSSSFGSIAIGRAANSAGADTNIAIGMEANNAGTGSTALGYKSNTLSSNYSVALSRGSTINQNNTLVAGGRSAGASIAITSIYFGTGIRAGYFEGSTTTVEQPGASYTIHGSGGGTTNQNGGNVTIAGGRGSGNGNPGDVIFSTSTKESAVPGTTFQSLTNRVWVKGDTGQLSVGTGSPDASALVQVESTTQGFLPPRMTTAQRDAIGSPAAGLVIFNTTTTKLECYDGSTWQAAW